MWMMQLAFITYRNVGIAPLSTPFPYAPSFATTVVLIVAVWLQDGFLVGDTLLISSSKTLILGSL
jgi:hypothetical protein